MSISSSAFILLLTITTIVSGGGNETPQQVVTRYNNYKTICTGLGYQNVRCNAGKQGKTVKYQSVYDTFCILKRYLFVCFLK